MLRSMARVGLVLGGGGAVGHGFHNGVLAALEDKMGFDAGGVDVILGTSSGATIAGLLRAGLSGTDLAGRACGEAASERMQLVDARRAQSCNPRVRRRERLQLGLALPASPRGALAALRRRGPHRASTVLGALLPAGPVPTVSAGGPLDNLFPDGWPDDALWICAVGIDDGRRVIFGRAGDPKTDVPTAVAASCALPGWFTPVVVENRNYVDGAIWSATNADVLLGEDLEIIVISAPLSGTTTALHRWQRRHLRDEVDQLRASGVEVVVIEPTRADLAAMGRNIMDKRRRPAVTRHVRATMRERLDRGDLAHAREIVHVG